MTGYRRVKRWLASQLRGGETSACINGSGEDSELNRYLEVVEEYYQTMRMIDRYDGLLEANPTAATVYRDRGLAYTLLGRHAEAKNDLDKAIQLGIDRRAVREEVKLIKNVTLNITELAA